MHWLGLYFPPTQATHSLDQDWVSQVAYGYSDQLAWLFPETLVLEIQRSRHLHSTPNTLAKELIHSLQASKQVIQSGLAPNPMAASLMSYQRRWCPDQESLIAALNHCPIECLRINTTTQKAMQRCGIYTVGSLWRQPSDQRIRRFGQSTEEHLQKIYGRVPTLISAWQPADPYYHRLDLIEPITDKHRLKHHIEKALQPLQEWLTKRNRALTRLSIRCKHEPVRSKTLADVLIELSLARPGFDASHLRTLLALKLDAINIKNPLSTLIIECQSTTQYTPPSRDLFTDHNKTGDWAELVDRLTTHLGSHTLTGLSPNPTHHPDDAWHWAHPSEIKEVDDPRQRPTWLLPKPIMCNIDQLILEKGPERIETQWWEEHNSQRDYWIARDPHGRRLWVFHAHKPKTGWFIQGIFG